MTFKRPRGTRDMTPGLMLRMRYVTDILRDTAEIAGFLEVGTPTFEHSELFIERSGEEVVDQMYVFDDKGGRSLALRPEITASVMRLYSSELRSEPKPIKVFYIGNCFRYERPQKGRYREFWQFGTEIIGNDSPFANAELMTLAADGIDSIGVEDCLMRVGHVGVLRTLVNCLGLDEKADLMALIDKGAFDEIRALDKGDALVYLLEVEDVEEARELFDSTEFAQALPEEFMDRFEDLATTLALLEAAGVEHRMDLGIARGLDYYTGIVFEIDVPSLGAEKQVCGGGSYDLGDIFGVPGTKATGFAMGVDRLMLSVGDLDDASLKGSEVHVVPLLDEASGVALNVAGTLRDEGLRTVLNLSCPKPGKAIKQALNAGALGIVFIGEDELADSTYTVKDLDKQTQATVPGEKLIDTVQALYE